MDNEKRFVELNRKCRDGEIDDDDYAAEYLRIQQDSELAKFFATVRKTKDADRRLRDDLIYRLALSSATASWRRPSVARLASRPTLRKPASRRHSEYTRYVTVAPSRWRNRMPRRSRSPGSSGGNARCLRRSILQPSNSGKPRSKWRRCLRGILG